MFQKGCKAFENIMRRNGLRSAVRSGPNSEPDEEGRNLLFAGGATKRREPNPI